MKTKNEKKETKTKNTKIKNTITIDYENKRLSVFYFLPLLLIAGFVPMIVYAKYVDLSGTTQALYWTGQQQYLDFFSYWKSRWVMGLTAIALIFYIILYTQKKLPFKNLKQYYIPLGVYAIFVIISTIFAKDTQTALWGFVDMYQGMFVLLSYVIITFLTINFVNNERDVKLFVNAFLFLMIVEGIIGVGQYFGFDFFQTGIGKDLIVPNNLKVDNLSFSFGPKTIYGTLFNTNFVGSFATLMLPLAVAFLLGFKNNKQKIVAGIAVVLMIFTWIGCNSRAGYLGVVVSAIFGIWLFRKVIKRYWKISSSIAAVLIILFMAMNFTSQGALINRIKSFNILGQINNIKTQDETAFKFEEIILGYNTIHIKTNKQTLNMKLDDNKLYFLDENMIELPITTQGNKILINDNDKYWHINNIQIPKNYPGVTITTYMGWGTLNFYFTQDGAKLLGSGGRITEPIVADSFKSLRGYEKLMSDRGYIWSRTLPLIGDNFIFGTGADNYPIAFPQDDFIAKLNIYMDANMVIDKPHNMYMQTAVNTGAISIISLLVTFFIYIVTGFKLYSKIVYNTLEKYVGASCLISVIGYLISGFFNDNVVSVAPIFWLILGLGISINYIIMKKVDIKE